MVKDPRVIVAYKKTRYEHYMKGEEAAYIEQLARQSRGDVQELRDAHDLHRHNLQNVADILEQNGLDHDLAYRGDVTSGEDYDLIISVGGDGTVLELSHRISTTPIVAINSAPSRSVGYFCAGTASDFESLLHRIIEGDEPMFELTRFYLALNGSQQSPPVLNDLLISHENPAAVSEYTIEVGENPPETHKSSGVWISTAAGSTAAIRSAGGDVMPLDSRDFQYRVREPYPPREREYRCLQGIHSLETTFELTARMSRGHIYLDGPHITFSFSLGDTVTLRDGAPPLCIFGLDRSRRTSDNRLSV